MRNCFTVRTAVTSCSGPVTHPIFQPVNDSVLPADEALRSWVRFTFVKRESVLHEAADRLAGLRR